MSLEMALKQPFPEAVAFFRSKLDIPTGRWDDLWRDQHAKGFMIAGAVQTELLADLRTAVDEAITAGETLAGFRKTFDAIVKRYGWSYNGSRNWRSSVIYHTNIRAAYNAGRWHQLTDPEQLQQRPYLEYRHGDSRHPRQEHLAWDGLVLKADDPWWQTHYPANGWGCKCRVFSLGRRDLERLGKTGPDTAPKTVIDPATGTAAGIDPGFDYNVGAASDKSYRLLAEKFETLPGDFARKWLGRFLDGPAFKAFFQGDIRGEFPVAVLEPEDMAALQTSAQSVWLSAETLQTHRQKHPEIGLDDYRRLPEILAEGEVWQQGETRLIYLRDKERYYRAALKRTRDGRENFFLTLFETTRDKADRDVRNKYKRIR